MGTRFPLIVLPFPTRTHVWGSGRSFAGGLKCEMAQNFMDKPSMEEAGPRDVMCGFALCHGGNGKKGLFRVAASSN